MAGTFPYELEVGTLDGGRRALEDYRGKVLLVVNTASKCGFTPQYEGLEQLYRKYHDEGLEILGFPCNQFASQEPGDAEEIAKFCSLTYDVSFPMFEKVDVNGPAAHPLFQALKKAKPGLLGTEAVKWNFTKFLIGRDGAVRARFAPKDTPASMERAVRAALAEAAPTEPAHG
ncbi:MAG: glutathione peroxidase [Pseudomonadales bacterium]|jgi:glutathione peroxidase|nr:glutathione peroxidase [Pseudomonadales bacterium]